jgi:polar amino acid transport system substrate-binding protein
MTHPAATRAFLRIGLPILLALACPASAAEGIAEVRAVTTPAPPFVIDEGGRLTGFSIDLWNEVAARLELRSRYRVVPDVDALAAALRAGEADVAASAVFFTSERDRSFDFSYPFLQAGQQVMVPAAGQASSDRPLGAFLRVLFSGSMGHWLVAALILVVGPAHVLWLLERRTEGGVSQSGKYFPGIVHALVWTAESLVGQADQKPRRFVARLLAIVWLFTGVVFVAFFTAQLTTDLTIRQIRGAINGPEDLPGKRVGAIEGSPAVPYVRGVGGLVREYGQPGQMYSALLSGEVDAVVYGAPALKYFASHEGLGRVRLAGAEFRKADLGFVFPLGSPLRKRVSTALLSMKEDGTYQRIRDRWFGGE